MTARLPLSLTEFRLPQAFNASILPLALLLSTAWLSGCGKPADAQGGPAPAAPVSVAPAVQRTISDNEEFSGRLEVLPRHNEPLRDPPRFVFAMN